MALFEIKDLTFRYPESDTEALKEIELKIDQGEFVVILGKSGCGKSTLIRHLKSALTPHGERKGQVLYFGRELEKVPQRVQAGEIGYVMQSPDNQIVTDKVWHELAFGLENLGYEKSRIRLRVAEMANYFGIQNWFSKNVDELSGGQKQLLNLAAIMVMQPKVLILDEPTSQLDPIAAGEFLTTVKKINTELGTTVVIVEHRLEEVFPMADRVLALDHGKTLVFDTPGRAGQKLAKDDLSYALPTPVKIYNETGQPGECPLTVREGRGWLETFFCAGKERQEEKKIPNRFGIRRNKEKDAVAIEVKDAWFRYDKDLPDVVKGLSMKVKEGELYCLLGGNGAGKTTTLSMLAGLKRPYRGKIFLQGKNIRDLKDKEKFARLLGVLPQNPQTLFVGNTVEEDLWEMKSGLSFLGKEEFRRRLEQVVKDTEITHLLHMHPYDLSGGEQQRAALAKVLLLEPKLLLLDEPTKGLDGFYKQKLAEIFEKLKQQGVTIWMVSHDIEFCAAYADTCALYFDGSIVAAEETKEFFAGNSFYTTAASRMARNLFPQAVTVKDVIGLCRKNRRQD